MGEYSKSQAQELGISIFGVVEALKDGVQAEDAGAAMTLLSAFTTAADEISSDTDAAVLDIISGLASAFADSKRDPVVGDELAHD